MCDITLQCGALNSLHKWLWHFVPAPNTPPPLQLPHKGQGRSLKSTGPPSPASASRRDMMTAMAASSLLGLLEPGSSIISMLRWELSPWMENKSFRKCGGGQRRTTCATHSWWTGWSKGSLQSLVQEWSLHLGVQVSLHSESIDTHHGSDHQTQF